MPPPPTGTTNQSGARPSWATVSKAMVFGPSDCQGESAAMVLAWNQLSSSARSRRSISSKVVSTAATVAPKASIGFSRSAGVPFGMRIRQGRLARAL